MRELHLSLITYEFTEPLQQALQQFSRETNIKVEVEILEHQEQSALTNYAIYKSGPDISEVGSTWLSNLVSMQAIRPYQESEIRKIGGEVSFVKGNWGSGIRNNQTYGIPWRGDVRVINYRTDLLEKAGIKQETAFASVEDLCDTVRKLQKLDDVLPWALNTARDSMLIHIIAPWIWNAGGHFLSDDGRKTMFCEPESLSGMQTYFETFAPAITPDARDLPDHVASDLFIQGNAAAVISGHWITDNLYQYNADSLTIKNLGVAPMPGAQYSGGLNLVLWNHSIRTEDALKLVQFLTRPDIQAKFLPAAGFLPVRMEALDQPPYNTDPNYKMLSESLISGRHLTAAYMWGMVEDQLVTALHSIWQVLFEDPQVNLEELLSSRLEPLAKRLDQKLSLRF